MGTGDTVTQTIKDTVTQTIKDEELKSIIDNIKKQKKDVPKESDLLPPGVEAGEFGKDADTDSKEGDSDK
jgi:hypothetical protein